MGSPYSVGSNLPRRLTVAIAIYRLRFAVIHQPRLGPRHTLTASKEVILSAGSLKTPHIRSYIDS